MAIDTDGYSNAVSYPITLTTDTAGPHPDLTNIIVTPIDGKYKIQVRFVDDMSAVAKGKIIIDKNTGKSFNGADANFTISEIGSIGYVVTDEAGNQASGIIRLQDYYTVSSLQPTETITEPSTTEPPMIQPEEIPPISTDNQ